MRINKHKPEFYIKKYEQIKEFAQEKGIYFPYRSVREFQSDWNALKEEGIKNIDRTIKYNLQYNTNYKTALAEYRVAKELGLEVKLKDLKEMTTTEFAEENENLIMDLYNQKKAEGMSAKQAGSFISTYWFGSE